MRATIKGDEATLEDVQVSAIQGASPGGWVGHAFLGPGAELSEGEYDLTPEDGRSCAIQVVSVKDYIARFRCLGPLE
jgi:hypothetical protein